MGSARMVTKNHSTASARPPLGLHDSELLARIRAGESALFEQLMRRYNRSLYRAVRAILADENEVEDTMQQAYVSAFTHLEQFAGRAQFSTWLMQIAINEARGRRRARSVRQRLRERWRTLGLSLRASATLPDALADRQQSRHRLERAIELLPQKYREAFVLREIEEYETRDAAKVLGVSEDSVKTRLSRAKSMLRHTLGAQDVFEFEAPRCDRLVAAVQSRLRI